jgi:hypothetical protein
MKDWNKRQLLNGAGLALLSSGAALAQGQGDYVPPTRPKVVHRQAKTTKLFKAPGNYPNALAVSPDGLWIAQQKLEGAKAVKEHAPPQTGREDVWLVDWNGKLLKTLSSDSQDTSGLAFGDGCIWVGANIGPEGIYQVDMNGKQLSHRQMPLGHVDGGGCHGAQWHDNKLWVVANRLRGLVRMDPQSWTPEFMIPIYNETEDTKRWHDMTFDKDGFVWLVTGNDSKGFTSGKPGLAKYDAVTGDLLELVSFVPGACDPHGLEYHNGALIGVDAGYHPGWPVGDSPSSGYVFRIELL